MLANDVYWLTHHDWTGALRTSEQSAGVMVAAGLLAELTAAGAVDMRDGELVAVLPPAAGLDALAVEVMRQVADESQRHPVGSWLEFLAPDACDRVAHRLIAAGRALPKKVGLRRRTVAVANDGDTRPAWVHAGLVNAVRSKLPMTDDQRFLLGLVWDSSIQSHPLADAAVSHRSAAWEQLDQVTGNWRLLLDAATDLIRTVAVVR